MFSVDVRPDRQASVLALRGELDHHSVVQLREAADAILSRPRPAMLVVIDCTALEFCDSSGIGGLISVYQRLSVHGGTLRLAAVPGSVARVFKLTGLEHVISVYSTADAALIAGSGMQDSSAEGTPSSVHAASER
ncbi:STAS domain-containing protein [Streptomyces rameus]|uniref:Anti-sigma factor antagonist n=1 Tax=Streptomyces rameus TaxID=68261 RepID=A0ABP6HI13_9ACTN